MLKYRAFALLAGLILLTAAAALSGQGQADKTPAEPAKDGKDSKDKGEAKAKPLLPHGWSKLGLTDTQKQEVYKTRGTYQEKIKRLQEQIDGLKAEERAELDTILTPGQKARLKEVLAAEKKEQEKDKEKDKEKEKGSKE